MRKNHFFAFSSLLAMSLVSHAYAQATEATTYGDIFIEEEVPAAKSRGDMEVGYSQIIDNNLMSGHDVMMSVNARVGAHFKLGVDGVLYFQQMSQSGKQLERDLGQAGVKQKLNIPVGALYASSTFIPVFGRINFLNLKSMPMALEIRGGAGASQYKAERSNGKTLVPSIFGEAALRVYANENWSGRFSFRRTSDDFTDKRRSNYSHLILGVGRDF